MLSDASSMTAALVTLKPWRHSPSPASGTTLHWHNILTLVQLHTAVPSLLVKLLLVGASKQGRDMGKVSVEWGRTGGHHQPYPLQKMDTSQMSVEHHTNITAGVQTKKNTLEQIKQTHTHPNSSQPLCLVHFSLFLINGWHSNLNDWHRSERTHLGSRGWPHSMETGAPQLSLHQRGR